MSGQSLTDRIAAAQHSMTGSAISKAVCKATTHEVSGPKKKHLDCRLNLLLYTSLHASSKPPPSFLTKGSLYEQHLVHPLFLFAPTPSFPLIRPVPLTRHRHIPIDRDALYALRLL